MGKGIPKYPDGVSDSDEVSFARSKSDRSLLGVERDTDFTRRLETDILRNLFVTIANNLGVPISINADGSINVNATLSAVPPIPPGSTRVTETDFGSDAGTNDKFRTITSGKTLTLQTFSGGAEGSNGGSVIELFFAPNGDTTGLQLLFPIFVDASSDQVGITLPFVGDGTAAILLRRRRLSGGAVEMFGRWQGYEL